MMPNAEKIAVSLNSRMNSEVIVGRTRLTVCGMITYCIDCRYDMPSELDASSWPL